jgi:hypothetical protein
MQHDKTPPIAECSTAKDMATIEEQIVAHFAEKLSDPDRGLLRIARQLRNKLMHGDFTAALAKLEEFGLQQQRFGPSLSRKVHGQCFPHPRCMFDACGPRAHSRVGQGEQDNGLLWAAMVAVRPNIALDVRPVRHAVTKYASPVWYVEPKATEPQGC